MEKIRQVSNEEMMEIFQDPEKRKIFNTMSFERRYGRENGSNFTGDWKIDYKKEVIKKYGTDPSNWPSSSSWVVDAEESAKEDFEDYCKNTEGELYSHGDYYYLRLEGIGEARIKRDTAEDLGLVENTGSVGISISSEDDLANTSNQEKIEYIRYLENVINTIARGARKVHSEFTSKGPSYKYGERASSQIMQIIEDAINDSYND